MNRFSKQTLLCTSFLVMVWAISSLSCDFVTTQPSELSPSATQSVAATTPAPAPSPIATLLQPSPTLPPSPAPLLPTEPPATPAPQPVRFAVIGDYGEGNQAEEDVANLVKSWNPDFIITVGDNNYPDGAAETIDDRVGRFYHQYIFPYTGAFGPGGDVNRFFPTLGNHDYSTARAQPYFDYFTLPGNERYYDFTWGELHFFAIDSDSREPDGVGRSSVQAQWLKDGLAASTATWQVVYFHHPPYSSGLHGPVDWMRWPFAEWGADVLFAGHDHTYERLDVGGIPLFINGMGGGPIYYFVAIEPGSQARYNGDYGAMLVTADEQQMSFQFINRLGDVIDSFQITK
jgi:tartrate-resistant acid phosphatase type 5